MKCDKTMLRLYAVTDRAWTGKMSLADQVEAALKNGVTCVQLREKQLNDAAFLTEAQEIAALCRYYHIPFIVNDNVEIAIACQADGVHIGQEDMDLTAVRQKVGSKMIIGVSVHTVEEAIEAKKNSADYLGLGAVFSTATKTDVDVIPYDTVKAICQAVSIPTVAIGGISKSNVLQLTGSGVDGIAVVSAIFGAADPGQAAAVLRQLSDKMVQS